jgi:hypothetical protein
MGVEARLLDVEVKEIQADRVVFTGGPSESAEQIRMVGEKPAR